MKIPTFKRLYKEDFDAEQADLIDRLDQPINSNFEPIYEALNNKIDIRNNLASTVADVTVTVNTQGIPTTQVSFVLKLPTRVDGAQCIAATSQTNPPVYPTAGIFVTGVQSSTQGANRWIIKHVAGLPANIPFSLRILVFQN